MSKRYGINTITLIGGLTRDPEVKDLSEGSVCKLRLAVDGMARGGETGYIDVDVFGKAGEACTEHLSKGREVAVKGRLQWREWQPEGAANKRAEYSIVADQVQFLGGKGEAEQSSDSSGEQATETAEPIAA